MRLPCDSNEAEHIIAKLAEKQGLAISIIPLLDHSSDDLGAIQKGQIEVWFPN